MEISPQHRRLVAGTRPATTLPPVVYISADISISHEVGRRITKVCRNGTE